MKLIAATIILMFFSSITHAHYVWIEQGEKNKVHVYFGEWHKGLREKSEKLERFASSKVFLDDATEAVMLQMQANHLLANISTSSDVRMMLDSLPPRESKRKKGVSKTFYYSKTGRQETNSIMTFEMSPVTAGSNQFILLFNGKPLERAEVTIFGPPKWQQVMKTDEAGIITIETPWAGTYLIKTKHEIAPKSSVSSLKDPKIRHMFTWTIHVENGIKWDAK